jgi:hypothetical protein
MESISGCLKKCCARRAGDKRQMSGGTIDLYCKSTQRSYDHNCLPSREKGYNEAALITVTLYCSPTEEDEMRMPATVF